MEAEDGGFLATVLRGRAGKHAANLADQLALRPQPARGVEELAHLSRHVAEPGQRSEDDRIGFPQIGHRGDRDIGECLLCLHRAHGREHVGRQGLGNAPQDDIGARHLPRALGDGLGHAMDVSVRRVEQNKQLHEWLLWLGIRRALKIARTPSACTRNGHTGYQSSPWRNTGITRLAGSRGEALRVRGWRRWAS